MGGVEGAGYGEGAGFGEGDTKMGSHYLDLFQHSTPWAAILAFVTVSCLQLRLAWPRTGCCPC